MNTPLFIFYHTRSYYSAFRLLILSIESASPFAVTGEANQQSQPMNTSCVCYV